VLAPRSGQAIVLITLCQLRKSCSLCFRSGAFHLDSRSILFVFQFPHPRQFQRGDLAGESRTRSTGACFCYQSSYRAIGVSDRFIDRRATCRSRL
jgi:hypothetical protein